VRLAHHCHPEFLSAERIVFRALILPKKIAQENVLISSYDFSVVVLFRPIFGQFSALPKTHF
jgi:hypothetical protein